MWMLWIGLALGQDYAAEAEAMMDLSFDLDEVEQQLSRQKRRAARAPAPAASGYDEPVPIQMASPAIPRLPLEPNSTLDAVTVYRDRALITRQREVELQPGLQAVSFEGLPHAILEDGLAASLSGGQARIVSVELRSGVGEVEDTQRIEAVRTEAETLVEDLGEVRDRIEALLAQRAYLRTALVPEGATTAPALSQVERALQTIGDTERSIARSLREQSDEAEDLAEELEPLLIKLEDPLATGREVRVEVEVDQTSTVALALRYPVSGAGWSPSYSARLDPASSQVELEVFGVVAQSTGEDWTEALVQLSTAEPVGRGNVPDLMPWTLGRSGSVGVFGALDLGAGATTGAAPVVGRGAGGVVDSELTARVEGSGAVVLGIEGRRTIRGDGSAQRLPVGVQTLQAGIELASIPKLAPEVVRQATVRYDGALPLLPGPVSSFVDGDFVGSGAIAAVVPGEALELAFGADDRFRVTRQLVTRNQERAGRRATRYSFRFRTVVANHGDEAASVSLSDQLPLSEDDRIVVRTEELSGARLEGEDGSLMWTLEVPAGGRAQVEVAFTVQVPDELAWVASDLELLF